MTYGEQNIVVDVVSVIAIAIVFLVMSGLFSVGSVLGVVGTATIVTGIRLWCEKRNAERLGK